MAKEKDSSYYRSQTADIKEDIIIRIMRLMRDKGYTVIEDPNDVSIFYRITNEPRGGRTLSKFVNGQEVSYVRTATPLEELVDILELVENS